MSDDFTTLSGTLEAVWSRLEQGASDRAAPANLVTLATSGATGASARIVVLRAADRTAQTLTFFTHAASEKVTEIQQDNRGELLIWDAGSSFQIRLSVRLQIAEVSDDLWNSLGGGARLNYASHPTPGTVIETPDEAWSARPDPALMKRLIATVHAIDTVQIAPEGLRRARFEAGRSQWIAP